MPAPVVCAAVTPMGVTEKHDYGFGLRHRRTRKPRRESPAYDYGRFPKSHRVFVGSHRCDPDVSVGVAFDRWPGLPLGRR